MPAEEGGRARALYAALAVLVVAADQWTKLLVRQRFEPGGHDSTTVVPGFFEITHIHNTGAAFGVFQQWDSPWKTMLLNGFALAALGMVILFASRTPAGNRLLQLGLHGILAGAVGNLIDRLRFGYVVDFLDVFWRTHHWPAFNIADSAICVGVGLLYLEFLRQPKPEAAIAAPES